MNVYILFKKTSANKKQENNTKEFACLAFFVHCEKSNA